MELCPSRAKGAFGTASLLAGASAPVFLIAPPVAPFPCGAAPRPGRVPLCPPRRLLLTERRRVDLRLIATPPWGDTAAFRQGQPMPLDFRANQETGASPGFGFHKRRRLREKGYEPGPP